jgi:hypothetical protein
MTPDPTTEPGKPFLYKTAHRGLAAALMALGFELINVEHDEDATILVFGVSRMLLDAADSYTLDTLSVSAQRMGLAFEQLDDVASGHAAYGEMDIDDDL